MWEVEVIDVFFILSVRDVHGGNEVTGNISLVLNKSRDVLV